MFDATSRKFSGLRFDKLDLDDERNKPLIQKFEVRGIPRLVIVDSSENALYNGSPPRDEEGLAELIRKYQ